LFKVPGLAAASKLFFRDRNLGESSPHPARWYFRFGAVESLPRPSSCEPYCSCLRGPVQQQSLVYQCIIVFEKTNPFALHVFLHKWLEKQSRHCPDSVLRGFASYLRKMDATWASCTAGSSCTTRCRLTSLVALCSKTWCALHTLFRSGVLRCRQLKWSLCCAAM
jgi:hypothetical protein